MLWMAIKNTYHKKNQENQFWEIVSSEKHLNQMLETFISMKMEAEYIETIPTISFDRFHEDSEILTKMTSKVGLAQPKSSG